MRFLFALLASLTAFSAVAAPPSAVVTWTAPTANVDSSPIVGALTYNVYQGVQGGTLAKVQGPLSLTTVTITASLTYGSTQCFAVTAIANGMESAQTAPACAAVPFPTPGAPSQLTIIVR